MFINLKVAQKTICVHLLSYVIQQQYAVNKIQGVINVWYHVQLALSHPQIVRVVLFHITHQRIVQFTFVRKIIIVLLPLIMQLFNRHFQADNYFFGLVLIY